MSLKNLSLNKKLIGTFAALMSICMLASAGVFWQVLKSNQASAEQVRAQTILRHSENALEAMLKQVVDQRGFLLFADDASYNAVFQHRDDMIAEIDEARKAAADQPALLTSLKRMRDAADAFYSQLTEPRLAARKNVDVPLDEVLAIGATETAGLLDDFAAAAGDIKTGATALVDTMMAEQRRSQRDIMLALLIGGAAAGLIAAGLIWALSRAIVTPIVGMTRAMSELAAGNNDIAVPALGRGDEVGEMAKAVTVFKDAAIEKIRLEQESSSIRAAADRERMENDEIKVREAGLVEFAVDSLAKGLSDLANGDVTCRIETPFAGELDRLRVDFNEAVIKLQAALQSVGANAAAINAGAEEVRVAADDLARRTEQQAASVEETAAALEEVTTTVKDAATRADDVGKRVERARIGAEKSGDVVRRAVSAMEKISNSSSEIVNIISVIDDIAFQTNLLALNAGVEAARAGDAGKGFAVVAQEVRELAQRSANAAKEIKTLLTASSEQVDAGVSLVGETGKALEAIVVEVREINEHINAIVISTREQSTGLQEINVAVNTMDQGTQQNAAMVEQQTAASHALAAEADAMNTLLGQFNLGRPASEKSAGDLKKGQGRASANRTQPAAIPQRVASPVRTVASTAIAEASPRTRPVASPAHRLRGAVAQAFSAPAEPVKEDWTEF